LGSRKSRSPGKWITSVKVQSEREWWGLRGCAKDLNLQLQQPSYLNNNVLNYYFAYFKLLNFQSCAPIYRWQQRSG